jgi:hypothetical protein
LRDTDKRIQQAKVIRVVRKIHRTTGIFLFAVFFLVAVTGLLLGWKKHSGGAILPKSYNGSTTEMAQWLTTDSLHNIACRIVRDSISTNLSLELERIDYRPDKGMVKFVFIEGYWGIQLDCATGKLLHIERRRSDFIENIHDGSVWDYLFKTSEEQIKLVYTSVTGTALITFAATGFWLWIGPKRMNRGRDSDSIT